MTRLRRFLALSLIVSIAGLGLPLPSYAGMLPTESALSTGARAHLLRMLDRQDVRAELARYGVKPADVQARVAALSDQEAEQLAQRIDSLPAGGDGVGAVVGAVVLVFVILLITDLLGLTKVFPFTRPIR